MRTLVTLAFWCSLIGLTVATLVPVDYLPPQSQNIWDKAQHVAGFAWLALLGLWAYPQRAPAVVAGLTAWGGLIELMQMATGWRDGDWIDWLADAIGVLAMALAWRLLPGQWTGRRRPVDARA